MNSRAVLVGLVVCFAASGSAWGQSNGAELVAGAGAFAARCAVCHGQGATGDGPYASLLKTPPPDLTRLAARNEGRFPAARIRSVIDGRRIPIAHGTKEMPIWGEVWSEAGEHDKEIRARIIDIVGYLRQLQKP